MKTFLAVLFYFTMLTCLVSSIVFVWVYGIPVCPAVVTTVGCGIMTLFMIAAGLEELFSPVHEVERIAKALSALTK